MTRSHVTCPNLPRTASGRSPMEHLLRHRAGLIPDNPIGDYKDGPADSAWATGWRRSGSSLHVRARNFVTATSASSSSVDLVERVSGEGLDDFARKNDFRTARDGRHWISPRRDQRSNAIAAPTERERAERCFGESSMIREVASIGRGRRACGTVQHGGRCRDLCTDAP